MRRLATYLIPQSIRGRLLIAALVFTGAALIFASFSIGEVLERFVRRGLNERLDAQIALLVRSLRPDGSIDRKMLQEIGPFTQHDHGWGWRIQAPGETVTSATIVDVEDDPGPPGPDPEHRGPRHGPRHGPRSEHARGLYLRTLQRQTSGGPVTITVAAPRAVIDRMRDAAVRPLMMSLTALGAFLLIATLLQLRIGLRPLGQLKTSLRAIRGGRIQRIPADQPVELREVVGEINDLLDENEAALARARGHVANLAHGLKTPLATLNLKLAEAGRDPNGELADLVAQIDRGIRHHLGRARAASPGAPGQPQILLAGKIADLAAALGHIHAERGIVVTPAIPLRLTVKCDPQDLDEMLGNLLDNAWKWARSKIEIAAAASGTVVRITIDDDGPGLSSEAVERALIPGQRLDERGDGHGFGLPIARELAELHGGSLSLEASPLGGLRAVLVLPS